MLNKLTNKGESKMKKIKTRDLLGKGSMRNYFTKSHKKLPIAYIELCNQFLDDICWPSYFCGDVTYDGKYNITYNVTRFRKKYRTQILGRA